MPQRKPHNKNIRKESAAIARVLRRRLQVKRKRTKRLMLGLCLTAGCHKPLGNGRYCDFHLMKMAENQRRYRMGLTKTICAKGEVNIEKAMEEYNKDCDRKNIHYPYR